MKRNSLSQTKRQIIFARDNWACVYCGKEAKLEMVNRFRPMRKIMVLRDTEGRQYEIDHVLPVCLGGDNSFNNLVTACWACNSAKSGKKKKPAYYCFRVTL